MNAPNPDALDRRVLLPLFAVVAIDAMGAGVVLPLLPFYSQHFGASPLTIGLLIAAYSLCQFLASPWIGRLSDRFGRKPVLLASQLGTLLSFVLLASASSLAMVFIARILDGLTAGNLSVASAHATDHSTPRNRKQAIGVVAGAMGTGIMIGPALAAALASVSISAPIWGAAALSAASVLATALLLPAAKPKATASPHAAAPKLPFRQLIAAPATLAVLGVLTAFYFAFGMFVSQLALFLHGQFSWQGAAFGATQVGLAFTAVGALNVFVQLVAMKHISQRVSETRLAIGSLLLLAGGLTLLALAHSLPQLAAAMLLTGLGAALARPTLMAALTLTAPPGQQGALMGVNTSMMAMANMTAPLLAGLLIEHGLYAGWGLTAAAIVLAAGSTTFWLVSRQRWPAHGQPGAAAA